MDFNDTSLIVSSTSVSLVSTIACKCDLDWCHFIVDEAFVQLDLEEDVFLGFRKGKVYSEMKQAE